MADIFFIIGFPRSATTALAAILNTATNADCLVEPAPRFRKESIDYMVRNAIDPQSLLRDKKWPFIRQTLENGRIYGEKNCCLLPFVPHILSMWDARFIFLTRDGRDCVTSLMNWHEKKAKNIFISPEDTPDATEGAEADLWDYSRMRPEPGDPKSKLWRTMTRFQQCAWYWNAYNKKALEIFEALPAHSWLQLGAEEFSPATLEAVFGFLGLEGFDADVVSAMLSQKINSLNDRLGVSGGFPSWPVWSAAQSEAFMEQAAPMMQTLGYAKS